MSMEFAQEHLYHAGFGDQGFLYNDAGSLTLVWSSYDPAFQALVGLVHPWNLAAEVQSMLEGRLVPAPVGGRWRFSNPARCRFCGSEVSAPMTQSIHFLVYDGSLVVDTPSVGRGLDLVLLSDGTKPRLP